MKADNRGGHTIHMSHVCKRYNKGCVRNMPQNPDAARVVYFNYNNWKAENIIPGTFKITITEAKEIFQMK